MEAEDEEEHGRAELGPAVGEPRWAWHMCDHQGGSKGFKLFEVVAIVTEGAAHTIDLGRNCYNGRRTKQGEAEVNGVCWKVLVDQKSSCGKEWAAFGVDEFPRKMWERFTIKKVWARTVLEDAARVTQLENIRKVATRDAVQGETRAFAAQH